MPLGSASAARGRWVPSMGESGTGSLRGKPHGAPFADRYALHRVSAALAGGTAGRGWLYSRHIPVTPFLHDFAVIKQDKSRSAHPSGAG